VPADIKDVLYSTIDEIGKEKIRIAIAADIGTSEKYCAEIIGRCTSRLAGDNETLATLCEALLHFMLTASLLPSERKVGVRGSELDIVIPSTKILYKSPDKSLVIQIVRNDLAAKVRQAEAVQPHRANIWLVSANQLKADYRNYQLGTTGLQYSHMISDISAFLSEKGNRGLKLLH